MSSDTNCAYKGCENPDVRPVTVAVRGERAIHVELCAVHRQPLESLRRKAEDAAKRAAKPKRVVWDDAYVESLVDRAPRRMRG